MSEQTFKVGDKVEHVVYGAGEITYGPLNSQLGDYGYVVRFGDREQVASVSNLTPAPAFAAGDKVTANGTSYTVAAGPFLCNDNSFYVLATADGKHDTAWEPAITHAPADNIRVGDRVRVGKDEEEFVPGRLVGKVGTVREVRRENRLPYRVEFTSDRDTPHTVWYCAQVEKVDFETYNNITYDLSADYRDRDGDIWRLARVGDTVRASLHEDGPSEFSDRLEDVVREFGPLARA